MDPKADARPAGGASNRARQPPGPGFARLVSGVACLGVATLIVGIALTSADIIWRRVVGGAFMDIHDVTKLCLVAAASWSIPYGFVRGTHVTVDLLAERLPRRVQQVLEATNPLISTVLLCLLLWLTWEAAALHYTYGDASPNLGIPIVWYWGLMLSGLALAAIASAWRSLHALASWGRLTDGAER